MRALTICRAAVLSAGARTPPGRMLACSPPAHPAQGLVERRARDDRIGGEPDDRRAAPVEVVDLPEPEGRVHGEAVLLPGLQVGELPLGVRRPALDALDHLRELPPGERGCVRPRTVEHRKATVPPPGR